MTIRFRLLLIRVSSIALVLSADGNCLIYNKSFSLAVTLGSVDNESTVTYKRHVFVAPVHIIPDTAL